MVVKLSPENAETVARLTAQIERLKSDQVAMMGVNHGSVIQQMEAQRAQIFAEAMSAQHRLDFDTNFLFGFAAKNRIG